jgi:hypothetical protein
MAGLTLGSHIHSVFPSGTVVQARPEAKVALHGRGPGTKLAGAAAASGTVGAAGLSLTGLDPSTPYVLSGTVGGQRRVIYAQSEAT